MKKLFLLIVVPVVAVVLNQAYGMSASQSGKPAPDLGVGQLTSLPQSSEPPTRDVDGEVLGIVPVLRGAKCEFDSRFGKKTGSCDRHGSGVVIGMQREYIVVTARHVVDPLYEAEASGGGVVVNPTVALRLDEDIEQVPTGDLLAIDCRVVVGRFAAVPREVLLSRDSDLAVLRFSADEMPFVLKGADPISKQLKPWYAEYAPKMGDPVLAIGFAAGTSYSAEKPLSVIDADGGFLVCRGGVASGDSGGVMISESGGVYALVGLTVRSAPNFNQAVGVSWNRILPRLRSIQVGRDGASTDELGPGVAADWRVVAVPGTIPAAPNSNCVIRIK